MQDAGGRGTRSGVRGGKKNAQAKDDDWDFRRETRVGRNEIVGDAIMSPRTAKGQRRSSGRKRNSGERAQMSGLVFERAKFDPDGARKRALGAL